MLYLLSLLALVVFGNQLAAILFEFTQALFETPHPAFSFFLFIQCRACRRVRDWYFGVACTLCARVAGKSRVMALC